MRNFAECFPDGPIVQQPVAQLPWGHVVAITQRLKDPASRDFYIRETLAHGGSRSILEIQIQHRLHLRAGKAQNNFALTMPPAGFRADLIVEGKVIVELKSVELMSKVHYKQLFTYLKLADKRLGLLLNFGADLMKEGIKRIVNGLEETH